MNWVSRRGASRKSSAFRVGGNVATAPGSVVYQNELMQLIQYAPTTEAVFRRPLLIIPPWINKFYILDLREKNSFIRWAVGEGHTVFVISWVNPDARLAHKDFADYMREGALAALDAIEQATGEREANMVGYCLGGTLLGATLGYMAAKGDDRAKTATFFVSLGTLLMRTFIDQIPRELDEAALVDGASRFSILRRVIMPLVFPALVAGSIFTFSLSLGDIFTPLLVSKTNLIGNFIYTNYQTNLPLAAVFSLVPIVVMIVYLIIARRLGAFEHI